MAQTADQTLEAPQATTPAAAEPTQNQSIAVEIYDQIYNLRGTDPADPQYIPVGLATGSQFNLIMASDAMVKSAGGDVTRVIPVHEDRLKDMFPSRVTSAGLRITELALAHGEPSLVR